MLLSHVNQVPSGTDHSDALHHHLSPRESSGLGAAGFWFLCLFGHQLLPPTLNQLLTLAILPFIYFWVGVGGGSTFCIFFCGVRGVFDPRWFLAAALL